MDDLISEFITETSESLQLLDSELVKFEQDPENEKILGNIFRLVHTIKGTCGFLGLPRLESIAHASENVLGRIRDKTMAVSPQAISFVLASLDCIKSIIEYLGVNGQEPKGDDAELIANLNIFAEGGGNNTKLQTQKESIDISFANESISKSELIAFAAPIVIAEQPNKDAITLKAKETAILEGLAIEPKEREDAQGGSAQNQSIRVNLDVLENLMQMVSELVLTRNQLLQMAKNQNNTLLQATLQHLSNITSELQEGIMKTRMQPIGNAWSKFPRLIRDLAHDLGKRIELHMIGGETELDRQLIEMIKDPLTHMVRNSADHGLEIPSERKSVGKHETGNVTLSAFHEGGHIIIEISDDGRGLNLAKIKQKMLTSGNITEVEIAALSDQQIMQFIFNPGFSTADKVTSVSGRGVGMDVVRTNIEKMGGMVELNSVEGKGSRFHIKIPLTLAIIQALIIESGGERFALPQINIQELVRIGKATQYIIEYIDNAMVLRLREKLLPIVSLAHILGIKADHTIDEKTIFIVVCDVGGYNFGLIVDRIFDTEEIVVKPTSELLKNISVYSGNTILGDGNVIMILDPGGLSRFAGEREIVGSNAIADLRQEILSKKLVNFLIFKAGKGARRAVPLELVSRIENIDMSNIEMSGEHAVIQYRDTLMRLYHIDNIPIHAENIIKKVIVFSYDNSTFGLIADEIIDIVSTFYDLQLTSTQKGFLGSMIIEGKATDILDVAYLLREINGISHAISNTKNDNKSTVLFVEDSPFFRSLTVPFLENAGYNVVAAANANDALQLLEKESSIDIIITDIEMPEMDGFSFAELCRSSLKTTHIPIVGFSATKNEESIKRARKAGFKDFILKTNRGDLLQSIAYLLKHKEAV
jgi:two-component system chemotaxis sensor kinase CheA